MAEYVTLKSAASVPYKDGRHVAHNAGDVVAVSDLSDHVQGRLKDGDAWLDNLFEKSGKPEKEEVDRMGVDAAKLAMESVEQLTRERANLSEEERHGADSRYVHDFDKGRTLPTSGADIPADEKFAAGSADTSENVPEEHAKQYGEVDTKASKAPRAVEPKPKGDKKESDK